MTLWHLIFVMTISYTGASKIIIRESTVEERWSSSFLTAKILDQCTDSCKIAGITIMGNTSLELLQCIHDLKNSSYYTITSDHSYRLKKICPAIEWTPDKSCTLKPMKTSLNLIMTNDINDFESTLTYSKHMLHDHWLTSSYHMIIFRTSCDKATARSTLKLAWKFNILNVILICYVKSSDDENIKIYTFNPYSMDHVYPWRLVSKEIIEVPLYSYNFNHSWYLYERNFRFANWTVTEIISDKMRSKNERKFSENDDLCKTFFFDKTRNLQNYVIPVSIVPFSPTVILRDNKTGLEKWVGEDGLILQTIGQKLRFRIHEVPYDVEDPLGSKLLNGSFVGTIRHIAFGRSNIALPSRYIETISEMDATYPHVRSGTCFLTLSPGYYPIWMNIILIWDCWILITLLIVCLCLILLYSKIENDRGIVWAALNTYKIILGISTKYLSKSVQHRCIVGSVILVMLITNGIFTGRLVSLLTIPRAYKPIDTIQQLKDSGMTIYGFKPFIHLMVDPVLRSRYRPEIYSHCLYKIIEDNDNRACMMDCLLAELWEAKSPRLYKAKEKVRSWLLTHIISTNWPLLERYDFENFRIIESGLRYKWRRDVMRDVHVSTWSWRRAMNPASFNPIRLRTLLLPFIILVGGLALATVIFVLEISLKRH